MSQPADIDPSVQTKCQAINAEIIQSVAARVLGSSKVEVVYDRQGRVGQKGIDLVPDATMHRSYDVHNEAGPDDPNIEIIGVHFDESFVSETGFYAVRTHVFADGRTGEEEGETNGFDSEIRWRSKTHGEPIEYDYSIACSRNILERFVRADFKAS